MHLDPRGEWTHIDGNMGITIAIDGPAGAGKSTVARTVAERLGYTLVDTGAIYRAVALVARRRGIGWQDDTGLAALVDDLEVSFSLSGGENRVLVAGEDISEAIRTPDISMGASQVSARPVVREGLLELQRRLAGRGGAVLEGRDIGTVVFPEAPLKIFLHASAEERARRRHHELLERGDRPNYEEVLADLVRRDKQDEEREVAPLVPASDALILDSTQLTVEQVVEQVMARARQAGA